MVLKRSTFTVLPRSSLKRNFSTGAHLRSKKLEEMFNAAYKKYLDKRTGGGFFEPSEKILKELEEAQKALLQKYGAKDESEIATFPKFEFEDAKIDPILEPPMECKYCDELREPKTEEKAPKQSKAKEKPKDGDGKKDKKDQKSQKTQKDQKDPKDKKKK